MNNTIFGLVLAFVQISKDLRPEYIEHWLKGQVKDFDMDMMLLDEKRCRLSTYQRLASEIQKLESGK